MAEDDSTLPSPDPGELLARALNTPGPTGGGRWTPPALEELAALLPQYRIESLLGHGGMGAVYKGVQVALKRPVAIKLLPLEVSADPAFARRFEHEAQTLAKLSHPNIVGVYDFGTTSEGHLYFVMEFVEGTDLHKMIHGPGLNPAQSLSIIIAVCEALQYAHGKGVVHRDIKPANVLVNTEGTVKVADFGLARLNAPESESGGLTMTGTVMGTPAYMAPEQTRGMHVDHRADIYSLGVMLYEMLCGEIPRGVFDPPSHKVQVDVRLDEVVLKAMNSEPERRYQNTVEMKTDVDRIRTTPEQRKPAPKPKSKSLLAAIVTVCLSLASAAGFVIWKKAHQPGEAEQAVAKWPARSPVRKETAAPPDPAAQRTVRTTPTTLDLLALVDVQRDRLKAEGNAGVNQWTKSGGQLAFVSVDKRAGKIAAPVALNGLRDYEVEIGVTTASEAPVILDLPMSATNQATVAFVPGQVVLMRDGNNSKEFGTWPKDADNPPWKLAARVKFDADGTNGTISATINGTSVGEWRGALGKLGKTTEPHPDFPGQLVPALYVRSGDRTHSSWTLRVFEGEAKVLRGGPPPVSPSPSLPVSSSPSSATKDALFINTLGMKFVPVPIIGPARSASPSDAGGGPTNGQRVLFSVWETRVQDYAAFATETKRAWSKPKFEQGPTHPAVMVSWEDAQAFCTWLTERERKTGKLAAYECYRLPSDHEWSCAAGIGDREDPALAPSAKDGRVPGVYPWGGTWPPPEGAGNYSGAEAAGHEAYTMQKILPGYRDEFPETAPVGSFAPNANGLYDLGGNATEWCEELAGIAGEPLGESRILRGASFSSGTRLLSSERGSINQAYRVEAHGFRVVLAPVAP